MLNIEDINIADSEIISTIKEKNKIIITCNSVYNLISHKYIDGIRITIKDWSDFKIKIFTSSQPFDVPSEKILKENEVEEFEEFEIIQIIEKINNLLLLKGFSKNSGKWIEYLFENAVLEVMET